MVLTLNEWLDMQKNTVRTCDGPESTIPKVIFIGKLTEDGMVVARMKLVAVAEWENFQEAWRKVIGADYLDKDNPLRQLPQFFLIRS